MKKILFIFGTRPEAIKMAPVITAFQESSNYISNICITAQHREMLDQVLNFFNLNPDFDLNVMKPNQNLFDLTSTIISKLRSVLEEFCPDFVFVHGDTTTSMAASLASFYHGSKLCHVEAGLRTFNKKSPYPEEINRQLTGRLTDFHFAPTEQSKLNLLNENIPEENILVTGNTVIDALLMSVEKIKTKPTKNILKLEEKINNQPFILVTGHRRENHGKGFENICKALSKISEKKKDHLIIYPVHLNPKVKLPVIKYLGNKKNILLIDPQAYEDFIWLMDKSKLIITDSGGVQEEAPSLGKPVLVMRNNTERPEAVNAGTVILVGTNHKKIVNETLLLLNDKNKYKKMSLLHNPYGDGKASERILKFFNKNLL